MLATAARWTYLTVAITLTQLAFANSAPNALRVAARAQNTLFKAAASGNRALVEHLLGTGVDPKIKNSEGLFPFHIAAQAKQPAIAAILLKAMHGKDGSDDKSWTPMHWAVLARDWEMLRELLREGAKFRYRATMRYTVVRDRTYQDPYDVASLVNHAETFVTIIKEEGRNDILYKLVEKAVSSDDYPIILEKLKHFGIDLQTDLKAAEVAIYTAVRQKNVEVARYLLESGLHQDAYIGRAHLHNGSALYEAEMIALLLQHGVDPNAPNGHGHSSPLITLYSIARKYRPGSALTLLQNGADPNMSITSTGNIYDTATTPLFAIIEQMKKRYTYGNSRDSFEDLKELLEHGADPNYRYAGGQRALHEIFEVFRYHSWYGRNNSLVRNQLRESTKILLQYGANPDLENAHGVSARQFAQKESERDEISDDKRKTWQAILELMATDSDAS